MLDKGPSGLKVLVPININVKTSLLLQYRQELEDYEENCKLQSLWTFKILHRPSRGGAEDEEGDWVGGSTTEEDGEED